jgi:acyl transferase domain-containing protein
MQDIVFTLAMIRGPLDQRTFLLRQEDGVIARGPVTMRCLTNASLVFTFSGQGAQCPAMGQGLLQSNQCFRDDIRKMDTMVQSLPSPLR